MNKKNLYNAIGVVAFVIGGLLARGNAMEAAEKLDNMMRRNKHEDETDPDEFALGNN